MITFFDTNILVFTSANQDIYKQKISEKLIAFDIDCNKLVLYSRVNIEIL